MDVYNTSNKYNKLFYKMIKGSFVFYALNFWWISFKGWIRIKTSSYTFDDWVKSARGVVRGTEKVGGRFNLTGLENINKIEGPVVFIGNHMSALEPVIFSWPLFNRPFRIVCKKSLLKLPLMGAILRAVDAIPVSRISPRDDLRKVLDEGSKAIQNGMSVVIFGQGKRAVKLDTKQFSTLGIKLARYNNVSIVPFALKTDFLERGKYFKSYGNLSPSKTIHFSFSKPISLSTRDQDTKNEIIKFIQMRLNEWEQS